MKKKLAFLMVALVAVGAFALQTSFRAFNNATAAEDWEITAGAYGLLGQAEQSLVGQTASVTIDGTSISLTVTASSIPVTLNGTLSGTTVTFPKGQAVMGTYYLIGSNADQTSVTDIVFTYDEAAQTLTQQTPLIVVSNSPTSIGFAMAYFKDVVLQGASASTSHYYKKVTTASDLSNGEYLIVYEGDNTHAAVAFDGSLSTLDVAENGVAVTISDGAIASSTALDAATFTIASTADGYTVKSASGFFVGQTSHANGLKTSETAAAGYYHGISFDGSGNAVLSIDTSTDAVTQSVTMRYNYADNQLRFRYYKNGQQPIALYKKVAGEMPVAEFDYYVVGKFSGTDSWGPAPERKMTRNTAADTEEYMLTMNLTANDELKVVKSSDGTTVDTWYPDPGDNYAITAAGEYTVYFRPNGDGNNDWYCNVIYVAATPISTIAEAQAADAGTTVTVEGTVVASAASGAVLYDGTDFIYYYNTSNALQLKHKVRMKGAVSVYGGAKQFNSDAVITDLGEVDYSDPDPVVLDGAALNATVTAGTVTRQFVALQGHLNINGNYYNITVEGAEGVQGSIVKPKEDLSAYNDKDVVVYGYAMYMTGSTTKYVYIVSTIVGEPLDPVEPVVWPEGVEGETWSITTTAAQTGGATQNIENEPCRVAYLADAAEAYLQAPFTLQGRQFVVTLKGSVDANKNVTIPMGQLVAQDPTQGLSAYIFAKNADQEFDDVVLTYSETAEKLSLKYEGNIYLYLTGDPGSTDVPVFTLTNTEVFKELSVQSDGLYIVGNTINNWDVTNMTAMTYNEQTQAYEYVLSATETSYFAISDVDADANTVVDYNKDMREYTSFPFYVMGYEPQFSAEEGLISENPGGWYQYFIADGVNVEVGQAYKLTCEIKSAKAGNVTAVMRWSWDEDPSTGTLALEAGDWKEYSCLFAPVNGSPVGVILQPGTFDGRFCIRNVKISHVEGNWDDFNRNHRYALGQGDVDATLNEEVQLQKVNGTIVVPAGDYKISVTNDMKMTITGEAPAPDQLYLVGNTINNWDLSNMTAMTYNSLDRTFSYNLTADEKTYFAVSDVDADANTVVDYNQDMREYTSFPFYVMGYEPQFSAEEGLISENPGGWYQYFIADGVNVEVGQAYKLTCEIKSAKAGNVTAVMRWSWDEDPSTGTLALEAGDWKEYSCLFAPVNGSPVGVILQPGTFDGRFCIRNVKITHEEGNWTDFNANHRYALGEGDVDATLNEELQLQKVNGSVVLNPGEYTITIDENMKMTITGEEAPQQEKLYIIGSMNGWDRTAMTEMTIDAATGNYMYEYSPTEEAYFAFATYQQTAEEAEADPNWETFNSEYRWAIAEGDQLAELDTPYDLQKVNGTIKLPAGQYFIIVTPEMRMMITGEVGPTLEDGFYVVGNMTDWVPNADYKMTENTEAGDVLEFMYTMDLTTTSQFKIVKVEGNNQTWYPDGMGNNYGEHGEITADGEYNIYFRPNADGGDDWFYNVIFVAPVGEEPNPYLDGDFIYWTADDVCNKGEAEDSYGSESFYVTCVDTDNNKHQVDANNAYFGDANHQVKFTHRFKTGGKSSAKNSLTLTIPSDGKLSVYVRTGSNDATDRNLVLTQAETELYNAVVQEADAILVAPEDLNADSPAKAEGDPVKVYPIITVDVVAGEVIVGYPVNGLNFYAFQLVSETTGIVNIMPEQQGFDESLPAYNLQGQRVTKSYRGIVIQNGRKFMNK